MNWTDRDNLPYFILGSELNAYLKQVKVILSTVKKYHIFSLVMNTLVASTSLNLSRNSLKKKVLLYSKFVFENQMW